ncbi:MAG TPA: TonB-dependent receptor [Longimicrobiales bacterium]|nr:TonB-dependent receptor [Longimicrobiales bacterium]
MRIHFVLAAVLLAAPCALDAQARATASIEGRVTDAESGEPVPAVMVHVEDPRRHELTHEDGRYHLLQLPPGRYTVVFEALGYRTTTREVTLAVGDAAQLDVALAPAAIELEGLVVTATVGGRAAGDALRPTSVVAGRDLQRQLDGTIAGTLASEAGVAVASMGPGPARPVIRGLGGDRVLILEDGERVGDLSAGSADHAVAVDPIDAERIEVVRGPAALFYGSNALGGIVNVITEEIPTTLPDRLHGGATLQGRSVSEAMAGEASLANAFGRLSFRGSVSLRDAGALGTPLGDVPNTDLRTWGGSGGVAWVNGWGHIGGAARVYDSEYGIPPDSVAGHPSGVRIVTDRWAGRGQAHWTRGAGRFQHLELDAKMTRLDHAEIEANGEVGTRFGLNTNVVELLGRHGGLGPFARGAVGVRGQRNDFGADRGRGEILSVDEWSGALYALEELESGRFQLQVGGRFDYAAIEPTRGPDEVGGVAVRERSFGNATGSVSVLYELTSAAQLGVSASRAFRTPSSDELYSEGPHLASYTFEIGNPDLDAEVGHGADVFLRVGGDRLRGEVAGFYNRIDGFVHPLNTGDIRSGLFVYQATNTDASFVGGEASLDWTPLRRVVLEGTASYVRGQNEDLDEPLPFIPPLNGGLDVRYERTRWYVEGGWRGAASQERVPSRPELPAGSPGYCDETGGAAGCRPVPGDFVATDGYSLFNAAAGYRLEVGGAIHSLTLSVENITDEEYRNHLSRIKELLPEQGRSLNLVYRVGF